MAKATTTMIVCLSLLRVAMAATYSVTDYGAEADGQTDSTKAFLAAWSSACGAAGPATIYVPAGRFLVGQATTFQGPCNNSAITILVHGTLVAPAGYTSAVNWLLFKYVDGVSILGGTIDGRGQAFWACKDAGRSCPQGATSLSVAESKNVVIRGLTSLNSEMFHISIFGSSSVKVQGAKIIAPGDSPNTDGIHIQMSTEVTILSTRIKTGDDCISMGQGASGVWIEKVNCGPGHGISIGSLGGTASEAGVQNITVTSVFFSGTQNGLRIKTWGKSYSGFVRGVTFAHAVMQDVSYPIVVDQNYCPGNVNCPGQSSGVKISGVSYSDIRGSSATPVAVKFDCSASNPCSDLSLSDIKLTFENKEAQAYCKNAEGSTSGTINPPSCI
ncbi:polygalacturonase-like [Zingiber officinale]|uniref:polygalacturonase-like n=1 Tax=Zingiber officinale TaxID=94328 RepID=UPI001C4D11A6|nr:polygalacturonase-like [Zingiber officinale]